MNKNFFLAVAAIAVAYLSMVLPGPRSTKSLFWTYYRFQTMLLLAWSVIMGWHPAISTILLFAAVFGIENPIYLVTGRRPVWLRSELGKACLIDLSEHPIFRKHFSRIETVQTEVGRLTIRALSADKSRWINSVVEKSVYGPFPPTVITLLVWLLKDDYQTRKQSGADVGYEPSEKLHVASRRLYNFFGPNYMRVIENELGPVSMRLKHGTFWWMTKFRYHLPTDESLQKGMQDACSPNQTIQLHCQRQGPDVEERPN